MLVESQSFGWNFRSLIVSATIVYGSTKTIFSDGENTALPNYYEATVHRGRMHPYLTSLQKSRHHASWSSMEDDENNDEEGLSHTGGTSDGDSGIVLLCLIHNNTNNTNIFCIVSRFPLLTDRIYACVEDLLCQEISWHNIRLQSPHKWFCLFDLFIQFK